MIKKFLSLIAAFTLTSLAAFASDVWRIYTIADRNDVSLSPLPPKTYPADDAFLAGKTVTFVVELLNKDCAYNSKATPTNAQNKGTPWEFVKLGSELVPGNPTIAVNVGGRRDEAEIIGIMPAYNGFATALICEYTVKPGDLARPLELWTKGTSYYTITPSRLTTGTTIGIGAERPNLDDGIKAQVQNGDADAYEMSKAYQADAWRSNGTLSASNVYVQGIRYRDYDAPADGSNTWLSVRENSTELLSGEAAVEVTGTSTDNNSSTIYIWSGDDTIIDVVGSSLVSAGTANTYTIDGEGNRVTKTTPVYELVFSQGVCRFKLDAAKPNGKEGKSALIYLAPTKGMQLNGEKIVENYLSAKVAVVAPAKPSVKVRLDGAAEREVIPGSLSKPKMTLRLEGRTFTDPVTVNLAVSFKDRDGIDVADPTKLLIISDDELVASSKKNVTSYTFDPGETEKEIYYYLMGSPASNDVAGGITITPSCAVITETSQLQGARMIVAPAPAITSVNATGFQTGVEQNVVIKLADTPRNLSLAGGIDNDKISAVGNYKVEWFANTTDSVAAKKYETGKTGITFDKGTITIEGVKYNNKGDYTSRVVVTTPDGVELSQDVAVFVKERTYAKLVRVDGKEFTDAIGEDGNTTMFKIVLDPNPYHEGELYAFITDAANTGLIDTSVAGLPYAEGGKNGLLITSGETAPFSIKFKDNGNDTIENGQPVIKTVLCNTSRSYAAANEDKTYGTTSTRLIVDNTPAYVGKFRVKPSGKLFSTANAEAVIGKEYDYEATSKAALKTGVAGTTIQAGVADVVNDLTQKVLVEWRILSGEGQQTAIRYTYSEPDASGWVTCPDLPEFAYEGQHYIEVRVLDKDQVAAYIDNDDYRQLIDEPETVLLTDEDDSAFDASWGVMPKSRLGFKVTNNPGMSFELVGASISEDGTYLGWYEGTEEREVKITLDSMVTGVASAAFDVVITKIGVTDPSKAENASDFTIVGGTAFNKTTVTIDNNKTVGSFKIIAKDGYNASKYTITVTQQGTDKKFRDGTCDFAIYNRKPDLLVDGGIFTNDNSTLVSTNEVSVSAGQLCTVNWSIVDGSETSNNTWDGVKVTWTNGETGKSSDPQAPGADNGAGSYEITFKQPTPENVFRTLTVKWEDKDKAGGSMTWKVKVIPAKILTVYPLGPSSGVSSSSKIHTLFNGAADSGSQLLGARGRGNGSVEILEQGDFGAPTDKGDGAKRWMLGGADSVTLVAKPSDEKLTIINAAGEKEEFDQYFYSWLVATGIEGSNIYEVTRSGAPLSDMASNGRDSSKPIRLPSTLSEDGAGYPETIFEAVFSREFYPSDNCGDINGDGVPDLFVKHFGLGVFNGLALADETADLIDLSRYNDDDDYLPSPSASGYSTPGKTNAWTQAGTVFGAAEEIRGFHHGLNTYRWDRDTMAAGAQYLRPAGIVADRDMSDAELVAEQIAIDGGIEALHSITNAVHIQGAIADMVIAHGVTPVMTSLAEEYLKSYITEKGGSPDDDDEAELIASSVKSAVAGSIPGGLNTEIRETSDYTKFAATIFDSEYEYNGETTTIANTLKGAWELDKHNTAALDALVHSVSNQYRSALHQALVDARYTAATKNVETLSFEAVKKVIADYEIAKLDAAHAAALETYNAAKEAFDADPENNPDPGDAPVAPTEEEYAALRDAATLLVADKEVEIREKALDADHNALMDTLKVYYLVGGVEIESDAARSMSRTVWEVVNWTPERPTDPTLADTDNDGLPDGYEYWMWYRANIGWFAPYTYKDDNDNVHTVTNYYRLGMDTTNFQPIIPGKIVPKNDFTKGSGDMCGYRFDPENPTKFTKISAAEIASHFDPLVPANPADRYALDIDNDGISDYEEFVIGSNPISCDTSGDTIIDGWKLNKGLDIFDDCRDRQKGQWNVDNDAFATANASLYRTVVWGTERRRVDGELTDVPVKKVQIWVAKPDQEVAGFGSSDWIGYVMKNSALVREVVCEADDDVFSHIDEILSFHGDNGVLKPISHPDSGVFVSNLLCWNPTKGVSNNSLPIEVSAEFKYGAFVARDSAAETLAPSIDRNTATIWHNQVYKIYGFDPRTAWKDGILGLRWDTTKNPTCFYPEAGMAVNTSPFTTAHEYYSFWYKKYVEGLAGDSCSVICRNTTNPIDTLNSDGTLAAYGADTDMDGLPDGWEYYIGRDLNPLSALDPAKNQTDVGWDSDGLTVWQEFSGVDSMEAYRSVSTIQKFNHIAGGSKWFNKFFPTDPYGSDTDGDGISDGMEGAGWSDTFYAGRKEFPGTSFTFVYGNPIDNGSCCIRGGGMNPCTIDTDMDGIPDLWEVRHAGIVIGEDGSPLRAASGAYTAELKIADGWVKGNAHPNRPFIAGGMDATFASDTATITGSVDPYTGTVRDYDFDHDGLENFQEYLTQSIRHWRYDDAETPLMGHVINWLGDELPVDQTEFVAPNTILRGVLKNDLPAVAEGDGDLLFVKMDAFDNEAYEASVSNRFDELIYNDHNMYVKDWADEASKVIVRAQHYDYESLGYFAPPSKEFDLMNFYDDQINSPKYNGAGIKRAARYMRPPSTLVAYYTSREEGANGSLGAKRFQAFGFASTDPRRWDSDGDGMDDYYETFHGLNPLLGNVDMISSIYPDGAGVSAFANAWNNFGLGQGATFGFHVGAYNPVLQPWTMGLPEVDVDGDGLRNNEEMIMGNLTSPNTYHTDPTPAWMTDSSSKRSYVSMYYRFPTEFTQAYSWHLMGDDEDIYQSLSQYNNGKYAFSFEENEGYDTDGDWKADGTELVKSADQPSDPLDFTDPARRQAMYFTGNPGSAMMTKNLARPWQYTFDMLRQFTIECWVNPESVENEQVVVERSSVYLPARDEDFVVHEAGCFRANFRIGLAAGGQVYALFDDSKCVPSGSEPGLSSERINGPVLKTGEWVHVAATYDGKVFRLFINGRQYEEHVCSLIPATGLYTVSQDPSSTAHDYPVSKYGIADGAFVIGASLTDGANSVSSISGTPMLTAELLAKNFAGYVDEVRVWDGARKASDIAADYKKAYTASDVAALHENVYSFWSTGATRNDNDSKSTLPAELLINLGFETLPSAKNPDDVSQAPMGFAAAVPYALPIGWWDSADLASTVYANHCVIPTAQNTVGHLAMGDGSMWDSMYWLETGSGYTPISKHDLSTTGVPNSMNPYSSRSHNEDAYLHYWRMERLASGTGDSSYAELAKRYRFDLRGSFYASTDFYPLGDAYAKTCDKMWDGNGVSTAWADIGLTRVDDVMIPAWWKDLRGVTDESSLIEYKVGDETWNISPTEAYMRDLAAGYMPGDVIGDPTGTKSEADLNKNGIPDWWEDIYGVHNANEDFDNDGLSNYQEYLIERDLNLRADPRNAYSFSRDYIDYFHAYGEGNDQRYLGFVYTDHDFMEDEVEASVGSNRNVYDANLDADHNGWTNYEELRARLSGRSNNTLVEEKEILDTVEFDRNSTELNIFATTNKAEIAVTEYRSAVPYLTAQTGAGEGANTNYIAHQAGEWFTHSESNYTMGADGNPTGIENEIMWDRIRYTLKTIIPVYGYDGLPTPTIDLEITGVNPSDLATDEKGEDGEDTKAASNKVTLTAYSETRAGVDPVSFEVEPGKSVLKAFGIHAGKTTFIATCGKKSGIVRGVNVGWDYVGEVKIELTDGVEYIGTHSAPTIIDCCADRNYFLYAAQPVMRWDDAGNYTSFRLQIAKDEAFAEVVYDSGKRDIPAKTDAGRTFKPEIYVGHGLDDNSVYYWRVSEYTSSLVEDCWSATASFQTAVALKTLDTGYGKLNLIVHAYGPSVEKGKPVLVGVYKSAAFVDKPVALKKVDIANDMAVEFDGIEAGEYFVMAYQDVNDNGVRDDYETWGYLCGFGSISSDHWTPTTVEITTNRLVPAEASFYLEDTDVNQNEKPDCTEDMSNWKNHNNAGDNADTLDSDGDGIPDADEVTMGLNPYDPTDAAKAGSGDVMAYAEIEMTLVSLSDGTLALTDGEVQKGVAPAVDLYVTYAYGNGGIYGLGSKLDATTATVVGYKTVTVALVHDQVHAMFGFNSKTANPTVPVTEQVNTKPFTALDKYLVSLYAAANGKGPAEAYHLNPFVEDTDGDDIPDGWELYVGLRANDATDALADNDQDGLLNKDEYNHGMVLNPYKKDTNGDGITDDLVKKWNLYVKGADDDGDGLSNYAEYLIANVFKFSWGEGDNKKFVKHNNANSISADVSDYFLKVGDLYLGEIFTDHDQIDDAWEMAVGNVDAANSMVYDPNLDADGDGWTNYEEFCAGTNPNAVESANVISGYTLAEYPTPVIKATITNELGSDVGAINVVAWNEADDYDMLKVPSATWTIGSSKNTEGEKYLGLLPTTAKTYYIGPGTISGSTVKLELVDPVDYSESSWQPVAYDDANGNIVFGHTNKKTTEDGEGKKTEGETQFVGDTIIGSVDYQTGFVTIDFSNVALNGTFQQYSNNELIGELGNLRKCHAKISWSTTKSENKVSVAGTYYLADPDGVSEHLKGGKTTFMVWADLGTDDGVFQVGEPMAIVRGVEVGWAGGEFEVELTKTSPIFDRIDLSDGTTARKVVYTPEGEEDTTSSSEVTGDTESKQVLSDTLLAKRAVVQVYMMSYTDVNNHTWHIQKYEGIYGAEVIMSKEFNFDNRTYLTEADVLKPGEYDIAMENIAKIVNTANTDRGELYKVTFGVRIVSGRDEDRNIVCVELGSGVDRFFDGKQEYDENTGSTIVTKQLVPVNLKVDGGYGYVYGAHPTFSWTMPTASVSGQTFNSYTAFQVEIANITKIGTKTVTNTVYTSGAQKINVVNGGAYSWTAPISVGGQFPGGATFNPNAEYLWRVTMLNSKYQDATTKNGCYSEYSSFKTAVNAQQPANDHGYSSIEVTANYYGPKTVLSKLTELSTVGKIRVQAFSTPDFAGTPASETIVKANGGTAKLLGLKAGTYYLRAYIDMDGDFVKSDWESWGTCEPVVVGDTVATASITIEDADTDKDWLPDAWEYAVSGWTGDIDEVLAKKNDKINGNGVITLTQGIVNALTGNDQRANFSATLPGASLTTFQSADFAAALLGADFKTPTTGSVDAIREALKEKVKDNSVIITDFAIADGKITLKVAAETVNAISGTLANLYKRADKTDVKVTIYKTTNLAAANWTKVATETVTVKPGDIKVELSTHVETANGEFYTVTVE